MDPKKLATIIVAVIVGVILTSAILVPIVSDHTSAQKTVTNEGSYFTTPDDGEHTVVINAETITYDGEPCIYPDLSLYGSATLMVGEDWFVRLNTATGNTVAVTIAGPPQNYANMGNSADGDITIVINGTGISATSATQTTPIVRTGLTYTIADKGDYVLAHDPYVLANTEFVGAIRNTTAYDVFEIVSGPIGTVADYDTVACRLWSFGETVTGTMTGATYTTTLNTVDGDLKKLDVINQTIDMSFPEAGAVSRNITIDYVIVPVSITYDNPAYVGNNLSSMLNIIPIIVIMGLVVGLAAAFFAGRNDY